jgi:hypothetical protein
MYFALINYGMRISCRIDFRPDQVEVKFKAFSRSHLALYLPLSKEHTAQQRVASGNFPAGWTWRSMPTRCSARSHLRQSTKGVGRTRGIWDDRTQRPDASFQQNQNKDLASLTHCRPSTSVVKGALQPRPHRVLILKQPVEHLNAPIMAARFRRAALVRTPSLYTPRPT